MCLKETKNPVKLYKSNLWIHISLLHNSQVIFSSVELHLGCSLPQQLFLQTKKWFKTVIFNKSGYTLLRNHFCNTYLNQWSLDVKQPDLVSPGDLTEVCIHCVHKNLEKEIPNRKSIIWFISALNNASSWIITLWFYCYFSASLLNRMIRKLNCLGVYVLVKFFLKTAFQELCLITVYK